MCKWRWDAGVQLQFTQGLDCKNSKCQGSKHKTPKTAPFYRYCSSSSRLKRTPTAAPTITPAINTIYGLKKRLCSLAIKARDSPCTRGGEKNTQRLKIPDGKNPVDRGEAKPRHEKTRERPEKKLLKNQRKTGRTKRRKKNVEPRLNRERDRERKKPKEKKGRG